MCGKRENERRRVAPKIEDLFVADPPQTYEGLKFTSEGLWFWSLTHTWTLQIISEHL